MAGLRLTFISNPQTNSSTFAWIAATQNTVKLPFRRAKRSDSDIFVRRNRLIFFKIGSVNWNNTFFRGVTMSSTWQKKTCDRLTYLGKLACSRCRTGKSLLAFLWWSLTIQSYLLFIRPPNNFFLFFRRLREAFRYPPLILPSQKPGRFPGSSDININSI